MCVARHAANMIGLSLIIKEPCETEIAKEASIKPILTQFSLISLRALDLTINSLLDEILEVHIFSYFNLHYWISRLIPVCKRWKRICERSRSSHRHLTLRGRSNMTNAIKLVTKYQPTALQIEWTDSRLTKPIFSLIALVRASKYCTTLVMPSQTMALKAIKPLDHLKLTQITTLCIHAEDFPCLNFFPNVQNLQISYWHKNLERNMLPASVERLSVNSYGGRQYQYHGPVDVVLDLLNRPQDPSNVPDILEHFKLHSYVTFTMLRLNTKLAELIRLNRLEDAKIFLTTGETSLQREMELSGQETKYMDFIFTARPHKTNHHTQSVFDLDNFYDLEIAQDFYYQLNTCLIMVRPEIRLNLIGRFGTVDECIKELTTIEIRELHVKESRGFFLILFREEIMQLIIEDIELQQKVKAILKLNWFNFFLFSKESAQLDKLIEWQLIDWDAFIPYYNERVNREVYCHGVKLKIIHGSVEHLSSLPSLHSIVRYLSESTDWSIFDEILSADNNLVDKVLHFKSVHMTKEVYCKLIKQYNYDVNNIALFVVNEYHRLAECLANEFTIDWHLICTTQNSPFLQLSGNICRYDVIRLLQIGVDPRIVPGSQTVLGYFVEKRLHHIEVLDALLTFGVDINEPTIYQAKGTKHTPLSLAFMLNRTHQIEMLKSRGALTDEELAQTSD